MTLPRIPEPELMDDPAQARAYSDADFTAPHDFFIAQFKQAHPSFTSDDAVLDLGCRPADITVRFARAFPESQLIGIDGADAMLACGRERISEAGLTDRIQLRSLRLPDTAGLAPPYRTLISNSLLHHLPDPSVLWEAIHKLSEVGSRIFIMDLRRPASKEEAAQLRDHYASDEPAVLQHDFYHSLLAAFRPDEVQAQLDSAGLGYLTVLTPTDRHLIIHGIIQ